MVVQCCVCKKVRRQSGEWAAFAPPTPSETSHGYCPRCAEIALAEIRRRHQACREFAAASA